jgi:DnaK suppressor protein
MTKPVTVQSRREFVVKAREHLMHMRAALIHESASESRAVRSGRSGDAKDTADLASEESDQELAVMLAERGRGRTAEIDNALKRMDEADYGECEVCRLEIAEQRLMALPFTRYCVDCQRDQERELKSRRRRGDSHERGQFNELGHPSTDDDNQREPIRRAENLDD